MELNHIIIIASAVVISALIFSIFILESVKHYTQGYVKSHSNNNNSNGNQNLQALEIQAYERLVLFLERIKPESIVNRAIEPDITINQMRFRLHSLLEMEFEHNISQQLYVSEELWQSVNGCKTVMAKLIDKAIESLQNGNSYLDYGNAIIELYKSYELDAIENTISETKNEAQNKFVRF